MKADKKRMTMVFFIGLLAVGVGSLASAPPPIPVVITEVAKIADLSDNLSYPARVESKVNSAINAESDGVVTKILAPLGSRVHRGSKVAIIKHTDPIYQYAPMILPSQVDGIVSLVAVTEGSTVNKGALIASVTDPAQLKIIIEIAASDLSSFVKGMKGTFQISGESQEPIQVVVKGVSPFVDPSTGTANCELILEKPLATSLPPGSVGQARFEINHRKGFIFPENAIVYKGRETFLRVVNNGVAKRVAVVLGRRERGSVEVLRGVNEGDIIIDRSSDFIADGDKVKIESGGG